MSILSNYKGIQKYVYYLVIAEFLNQSINASFLIILNYYLVKLGYKDYEIAELTAYRYVSVLLLGIPLGFLYRKIKLLPVIRIGTLLFVLNALAIVYFAPTHHPILIPTLMFMFGVFLLLSHVVALPFLIKITEESRMSITLSMYFQTWASSIIFIGVVSYILKHIFPDFASEKNSLYFIISFAFIAVLLLLAIPKSLEEKSEKLMNEMQSQANRLDWKKLIIILIPTLVIAIGAGFSVPFFNLFFLFTYDMSAEDYSIIVGLSHFLVFGFMLFTPWIKSRFGYKIGIIGIQTLGIVCLFIMTWANVFLPLKIAFITAISFFILRQPLMNSAQPLIAEFNINIVGKKNQPVLGSIQATIWSGSFWFSSTLFAIFRKMELSYIHIFSITIILYILAVIAWYGVIKYFERK